MERRKSRLPTGVCLFPTRPRQVRALDVGSLWRAGCKDVRVTNAQLAEIAAEVARERGVCPEGMRVHMAAWLTVDRVAFLRLEELKMQIWSRAYL